MKWFLILMASLSLFAEETYAMIKPDAVKQGQVGEIITAYESKGLNIQALRMFQMSENDAETFYAEHRERPFFNDLINFITSGPVVGVILKGDNAIAENRQLMGATDPKNADAKTLRKRFGSTVQRNAVHGSDSPSSAIREIAWFYNLNASPI